MPNDALRRDIALYSLHIDQLAAAARAVLASTAADPDRRSLARIMVNAADYLLPQLECLSDHADDEPPVRPRRCVE